MKPNRLKNWLSGRREPRCPDLGPRELELLEILWQEANLSAQELQTRLQSGHSRISLSTIQSTLERLHRKRLADREKVGRAYLYSAAATRADLISLMLQEMSREIGGGDLEAMISGFAGFVADDDPEVERALTRILERKEGNDE